MYMVIRLRGGGQLEQNIEETIEIEVPYYSEEDFSEEDFSEEDFSEEDDGTGSKNPKKQSMENLVFM